MSEYTGSLSDYRWWAIVPACFLFGWVAGELDRDFFRAAGNLISETYINKFNAMSGANVDEYIYYAISDEIAPLQQLASQTTGINRVEATDLSTVFHVYIAAGSKHEMLSRLRAQPTVTAVFTVPFMCH